MADFCEVADFWDALLPERESLPLRESLMELKKLVDVVSSISAVELGRSTGLGNEEEDRLFEKALPECFVGEFKTR